MDDGAVARSPTNLTFPCLALHRILQHLANGGVVLGKEQELEDIRTAQFLC